MAVKIKGYSIKQSGVMPNVLPHPPNTDPQHITLVLHDEQHEPVFTEGEVRALIREMYDDWSARAYPRWLVDLATRHGVSLDHA